MSLNLNWHKIMFGPNKHNTSCQLRTRWWGHISGRRTAAESPLSWWLSVCRTKGTCWTGSDHRKPPPSTAQLRAPRWEAGTWSLQVIFTKPREPSRWTECVISPNFWSSSIFTDRGGKDYSKADRQGPSHVEELLTGGTHGYSGEAPHDARCVPGGSQDQGAPEESQRSDHCPHHTWRIQDNNNRWETNTAEDLNTRFTALFHCPLVLQ